MLSAQRPLFLLDVDNTLLDNDRFAADLGAQLDRSVGAGQRERYWALYAGLKRTLGYADYLGALQQLRLDNDDEPALLQLSAFLFDYPFAERFYPQARQTLRHLETLGTPVIFSDGDIVFQPHKIRRCGLWQAVAGRVLVYVHKQQRLAAMQQRFPAGHYVMVDDKALLLAAVKRELGTRVTTVFVRQGHYAAAVQTASVDPAPDLSVDHIGQLCHFALADFAAARQPSARANGPVPLITSSPEST
ncbi:HAD family hydrolase [Stenotrophomonas sp. YIM B06876]|uniref:HAD family hydrolase n=1 Tax=Stenotrophomonas sp. YIM B06876 TaxID=3060211 RepID=UPI0027396372|nr:HAD family hydrolase [Stenotrophomonas sp. YIM B06876]